MSSRHPSTTSEDVLDKRLVDDHGLNMSIDTKPSEVTSQTNSKPKRRRRPKRDGPPQLHFLVATDPSQFRDEDTKRSVRSQAMIHWRHEEDKKKKKTNQTDMSTFTPQDPSDQPSCASVAQQSLCRLRSTPPGQSIGSNQRSELGNSTWQPTASDTIEYFPRYRMKMQTSAESAVIDYEESERHEQRQLRAMASGLTAYYNVGGIIDPFDVLPRFRNPRLDALYLSRNCESQ